MTDTRCSCGAAMLGRTVIVKRRQGFSFVKAPLTVWFCAHCDGPCQSPAAMSCSSCARYGAVVSKRAREQQ